MKGLNFCEEKYVDEFGQWGDKLLMSYPGRFVSDSFSAVLSPCFGATQRPSSDRVDDLIYQMGVFPELLN